MSKYIEKLIELRGHEYDYSKAVYCGCKSKITIICKLHGEFQQRYDQHIKGSNCQKCANKSRSESLSDSVGDFKSKAVEIHGNNYNYDLIDKIRRKVKVPITCNSCKLEFLQRVDTHLEGHGCPQCNSNHLVGMTIKSFTTYCEINSNGLGTFYIAKLFKGGEVFYKVGITSLNVKTRFWKIPYDYTIIYQNTYDASKVYQDERTIKNKLKEFTYEPETPFDGSLTECFSVNPKDYLYLL